MSGSSSTTRSLGILRLQISDLRFQIDFRLQICPRLTYLTHLTRRQSHGERTAFAFDALYGHRPAVCGHDVLHHRETDAGAPDVTGRGSRSARELLKNARLFGWWNPEAAIAHGNGDVIQTSRARDIHLLPIARVLDRVVEQVPHGSGQRLAVYVSQLLARIGGAAENDAGVERLTKFLDDVPDEQADVHALDRIRAPAGFHPAEVQQR